MGGSRREEQEQDGKVRDALYLFRKMAIDGSNASGGLYERPHPVEKGYQGGICIGIIFAVPKRVECLRISQSGYKPSQVQ